METTNDRWVSSSPQTQVEIPNDMSAEAEVPVTEIPMNLSFGTLERTAPTSPHTHTHNPILKML